MIENIDLICYASSSSATNLVYISILTLCYIKCKDILEEGGLRRVSSSPQVD